MSAIESTAKSERWQGAGVSRLPVQEWIGGYPGRQTIPHMAGNPRSWPLSPRGSDTKPHLLFLHRRLEVCPLDPQSDTGWLLSVHPGCLISPSLSSSCCSVPSKTNTLWVPIRWGYFNALYIVPINIILRTLSIKPELNSSILRLN